MAQAGFCLALSGLLATCGRRESLQIPSTLLVWRMQTGMATHSESPGQLGKHSYTIFYINGINTFYTVF